MHLSMFIELSSVLSMLLIVVASYLVFSSEKELSVKFEKVSKTSFHLSIFVSAGWVIYWLSHIESIKQVGFILAYPSQLLLFASVLRVLSLLSNHFAKATDT
ncbi:hypothetical protein VSPL_30710 [Vibrio splendidus]|nr:hypothetical protein VSPL_30710 [Vibrio splendidus]